jgi:hypothetical protein
MEAAIKKAAHLAVSQLWCCQAEAAEQLTPLCLKPDGEQLLLFILQPRYSPKDQELRLE